MLADGFLWHLMQAVIPACKLKPQEAHREPARPSRICLTKCKLVGLWKFIYEAFKIFRRETISQRRRLAAGLEFEKRRAQLQSPVFKIELKFILN